MFIWEGRTDEGRGVLNEEARVAASCQKIKSCHGVQQLRRPQICNILYDETVARLVSSSFEKVVDALCTGQVESWYTIFFISILMFFFS